MSTDKKDMQLCLKTNKRLFLWYESLESHDASIEARGALDGAVVGVPMSRVEFKKSPQSLLHQGQVQETYKRNL